MYRLVATVLGVLALIAIILSLSGGLPFSPLELSCTLAVLVVVTYVSNRVISLLFRVKPHGESSIITGLLLFFLFFPTRDPNNLLVLALVAVIASLSKYILAFRGRHIFNPAAIAALIIAFTQLSAAVWWVGTPALLAPVVIGGFLVVYRVRRFGLVATFVAVALIISIVRLTLGGAGLGSAVALSIASSPILFFAFFMLDEPLTLPPLRWQQLSIAVLVAIIVEIPFAVGPIYNSPELGLVIGNLIAFFFGQKRSVALHFVASRRLSATTSELSFRPTKPVVFTPGQYLELELPHARADARGVRRRFSLASAPGSEIVTIGIRSPKISSSFKRSLRELTPGTRLRATSIGGDFTLPRDTSVPLLLVAGGIGITPFVSQLRHLVVSGEHRDVVVVYASSEPDELAYADELTAAGVSVLLLAPTVPRALPTGWSYLGSGHLDTTNLADRVARLTDRTAYVSGPPGMVTSLRRDLKKLGIRRIKTDYFSGY